MLGAQWLCTLGAVVWDFANLSMAYNANGQEYRLKGLPESNSKLVGPNLIAKHLCNSKHAYAIQLLTIESCQNSRIGALKFSIYWAHMMIYFPNHRAYHLNEMKLKLKKLLRIFYTMG